MWRIRLAGGYRGHEPVPGMLDTKSVMLMPGGFIPDSIVCCEPTGESVMLNFPAGILPAGGFILVFSEISDCAGNLLEERQINLGMPGRPEEGLMLINEVMYDPWEGDPEFIELLVRGSGYLDLADYAIGLAGAGIQDSGTGIYPDDQAEPVPLSYDSRLAGSGDYLLVSQNIPHLADHYRLEPSGRWIQAPDLGVLPNSGGLICLTDRAGNTIDRAPYGDDMHAELLGDTKGVSLERISPDRPGSAPENWHSAASIEGYSTPGRPNSQSIPPGGPGSNDGRLVVEPRVFSPDNDGYQDLLEIRVETGIQGYALHIRITDTNGIPVRYVADNHLAGPFISYTWDGEGDDGRMSAEGIYVVHLEAWHPVSGDRITERAAVGLIYP
ncbi:MAG: hypothetical protein EHM46_06885 [Bacteroidetes bacterium]|nr:MAG: hypothetical protein EHM46_06885 [Bacteroidota bacterium]